MAALFHMRKSVLNKVLRTDFFSHIRVVFQYLLPFPLAGTQVLLSSLSPVYP